MNVDSRMVPDTSDAVQQYESHGGHLTLYGTFGHDPLNVREDLVQQRESIFRENFPDFGPFFYGVVNNDDSFFRQGLLYLIELSRQLLSQL